MRRRLALASFVASLFIGAAHAGAPEPERSWWSGVSEEARARATERFDDGARYLRDAFFTRAVKELEAALADWDHPAIHFNLATALLNLDQPAEAYAHLWAALAHEGRPLGAAHIDQITRFLRVLYDNDLTHVVVTCALPGASLRVGGRELARGPEPWAGVLAVSGRPLSLWRDGRELAALQTPPRGRVTTVACTADGAGGATLRATATRPATEADMLALQRARHAYPKVWPPVAPSIPGIAPEPPVALEPLPPSAATRLCERARAGSDLATVCGELAATRSELASRLNDARIAERAARKRLEQMTHGGILDVLE